MHLGISAQIILLPNHAHHYPFWDTWNIPPDPQTVHLKNSMHLYTKSKILFSKAKELFLKVLV